MTKQQFTQAFEDAYGLALDVETCLMQIKNIMQHNLGFDEDSPLLCLLRDLDRGVETLQSTLADPEMVDEFHMYTVEDEEEEEEDNNETD